MNNKNFETIVAHLKASGFVFQGSQIYGGLANTWDYGPLGARLLNNIKDAWRKKFIQKRPNSYEIDAGILMHPKVWEASGHVSSFSDPLVDCRECKMRFRVDTLINDFDASVNADAMNETQMVAYLKEQKIPCPNCGKHNFTDLRQFNLMFETSRGVIKDEQSIIYLRPENAQGEYVNFLNVWRTMRAKLPFSIGQIGKAFRNEVTPGTFIFRTIEFEQMEFQTFCKEGEDSALYDYFKEYAKEFFNELGLPNDKLRYHDHEKLAHYAKAACDIDYLFPFGWGEINGTHNRTDFDLKRHQEFSGVTMSYLDSDTNERYIPFIVESTYGAGRIFLAILCEAYQQELLEDGETREVLHLAPFLAPFKAAVFPLIKKNLSEKAKEVYRNLSNYFMVEYDETGSIGKRYRRQDAIGTPYCITIDFDTLQDDTVTLRHRDSMQQERMKISELKDYIAKGVFY